MYPQPHAGQRVQIVNDVPANSPHGSRRLAARRWMQWLPALRHLALGIVDGPTRAEDLVERI
jgi:hypothetical protein